jgi:hypothetical protein
LYRNYHVFELVVRYMRQDGSLALSSLFPGWLAHEPSSEVPVGGFPPVTVSAPSSPASPAMPEAKKVSDDGVWEKVERDVLADRAPFGKSNFMMCDLWLTPMRS